jgi:hypothetical protein
MLYSEILQSLKCKYSSMMPILYHLRSSMKEQWESITVIVPFLYGSPGSLLYITGE